MDDKLLQNLVNQLLPSKQPLLTRLLLLFAGVLSVWASLSGLLVLLFNLVAPQFHAALMTYAEALGWIGFYLAVVGTSLLLKETK